jgi:hypothetical protein
LEPANPLSVHRLAAERGLWPLPKFYFDIRLGDCLIRDHDGTEAEDRNAALGFALAEVRELLMTKAGSKVDLPTSKVDVCDEARQLLFSVPFHEALRVSSAAG